MRNLALMSAYSAKTACTDIEENCSSAHLLNASAAHAELWRCIILQVATGMAARSTTTCSQIRGMIHMWMGKGIIRD